MIAVTGLALILCRPVILQQVIRPERLRYAGERPPSTRITLCRTRSCRRSLLRTLFGHLLASGSTRPRACLASHSADLAILLPLGGAICCQNEVNVPRATMISDLRRKHSGDEVRKPFAVVGCRKIIDNDGLAAHVAQLAQVWKNAWKRGDRVCNVPGSSVRKQSRGIAFDRWPSLTDAAARKARMPRTARRRPAKNAG